MTYSAFENFREDLVRRSARELFVGSYTVEENLWRIEADRKITLLSFGSKYGEDVTHSFLISLSVDQKGFLEVRWERGPVDHSLRSTTPIPLRRLTRYDLVVESSSPDMKKVSFFVDGSPAGSEILIASTGGSSDRCDLYAEVERIEPLLGRTDLRVRNFADYDFARRSPLESR